MNITRNQRSKPGFAGWRWLRLFHFAPNFLIWQRPQIAGPLSIFFAQVGDGLGRCLSFPPLLRFKSG